MIFFLLSVTLIIIFYQDIKTRTIHVLLPIIVFTLSLVINYNSKTLNYIMLIENIGFILINILGLFIYFSLKKRELYNPIDKSIGLGDVLFFFSLTPLLNLHSFVLFFILSLLFSALIFLVVNNKTKNNTIPLAGYISAFLVLVLFSDFILKTNFFFND